MVGMKTNYVASFSGGKDSLAMVLRLMEDKCPLTHVVFFDTGMEFNSIYRNIDRMQKICEEKRIIFHIIRPKTDFLTQMLIKPVCEGKCKEHYGYEWCGGCCRWRTSDKISMINDYLKSLDGKIVQYVGIAADEPDRIKNENNKLYPLVKWGWKESDCLEYCYRQGWNWNEETSVTKTGYVDLYKILKRVSCWCCKNKNLKELKAIYDYLPYYWGLLKGLQSRISLPFRSDGKTIFDLEKRFITESAQYSLVDYFEI